MRKPRDYDSELKALEDRARQLKDRRIRQLGELVIATGADALTSEQLAGALLAATETTDDATRKAWTHAGAAFFQRGAATRRSQLATTARALRRTRTACNRLLLMRARSDTRAWVVRRRERTRQLIELGGLVVKAGLVELTGDDRAALYGAMLEMAARLRGNDAEQALLLWRRRGQRAFADDVERPGR